MKKFLQQYLDRRLRERCVKYAHRSCQDNNKRLVDEAISIYRFIQNGLG